MTAANVARNVFEWLFRPAALRAARDGAVGDPRHDAAIRQAKLLLEVARRIEEPVAALPRGAQPAVLLALYSDAIYWMLAARRPGGDELPPDLRALWDTATPQALAPGGPDHPTAEALRPTLVDDYKPRSLAVPAADAARARAFAEALLWDSEAPLRRVNLVRAQRWMRLGAAALAVVLVIAGVRALARGPDLAAGKSFRISKEWSGWPSCLTSGDCKDLMFHTDTDTNPWVELDLGAPKTIKRVEVGNREDCCQDRALPLIVELSTDQKRWTQVARRDPEFVTWTATFPPKSARYVRLKVLRPSVLHLRSVAVY